MKPTYWLWSAYGLLAGAFVALLVSSLVTARQRDDARAIAHRLEQDRMVLCDHVRRDLAWAVVLARDPRPLEGAAYTQLEAGLTTAARHADGACVVLPVETRRVIEALGAPARTTIEFSDAELWQRDGLYAKALAAHGLTVDDVRQAVLQLNRALQEAAWREWPLVEERV